MEARHHIVMREGPWVCYQPWAATLYASKCRVTTGSEFVKGNTF